MKKPDIFDRLMAAEACKPVRPFYEKHKEQLLYLLFGGLTTVVSLGSYWIVNYILKQNEHTANVISWVLAVLFAFVTNRIWVFESHAKGVAAFFRQLLSFYGGRVLTFGLEELILLIFITWLDFDSMIVKVAAQIVVLILNYIVSKLIVFRKTT